MSNYSKTTWADRNVEHPTYYTETEIGGGVYEHTPAPGTITEAGTTVTAARMNNIETGIGESRWYAATTNSGNDYSITLDPVPSAYYNGMTIRAKINADNTGAATINCNTLGAKTIKKPNGLDVTTGNLKTNSVYTMVYNGTNFISQGSDSSGDATAADVVAGLYFSNDIDTNILGTGASAKRWASGSGTTEDSSTPNIAVSGLDFQPGYVIFEMDANYDHRVTYDQDQYANEDLNQENLYYSGSTNLTTNWTIAADGFSFEFNSNASYALVPYKWIAFEN